MNIKTSFTLAFSLLVLSLIGFAFAAQAWGGHHSHKTVLCHIPPGNPDNAHTIKVSNWAVEAHLNHGDTLGPCDEDDCDSDSDSDSDSDCNDSCTPPPCDCECDWNHFNCEPECETDSDCDNNLFCDGAETCVDGVCTPGEEPCNETEECNEDTNCCYLPPEPECLEDADCDDGLFCNGAETCDNEVCVPGLEPCDEDQECHEETDCCIDIPEPECLEDADCSNNNFCDGAEECIDGTCVDGVAPCPEYCDEANDTCFECNDDESCDNQIFCDGSEECENGHCVSGELPCDEEEICYESTERCLPPPDCTEDVECDNGIFCDGEEGCLNGFCVRGVAPCIRLECDEIAQVCIEDCDDCDAGPPVEPEPEPTPNPEPEEDIILSGSSVWSAIGCSSTQSSGGLFAFFALVLFGLGFRRKALPLLAVLLLASTSAMAEGTNHFQAAPGPDNYWVTNDPHTLDHLETSGWLILDYSNNPLVLRDANGNNVGMVINNQFNLQLAASLGLFDFIELGVAAPGAYMIGPGLNGNAINEVAVGDPRFQSKFTLFDNVFSAALLLQADLPLARLNAQPLTASLMGDPWPTLTPGLNLGLEFEYLKLGAQVSHTFRAPKTMGPETVGSTLNYSAGAQVNLIPDVWALTGDVYGNVGYPSPVFGNLFSDRVSSPLEGVVGTKVMIGPLALTAGVGTGIIQDYGSPDFRVFAGIGWVPVAEEERTCPECVCDEVTCPTPEPEPKLVVVKKDVILILEPVHFAFDKDVILESSYPVLEAVADALEAHPEIKKVSIEGHTDSIGSDEYNDDLSQRRVESVRQFLIKEGIDKERLTAKGFGEKRPIVPNDSVENRAKNRRVEFKILERTE